MSVILLTLVRRLNTQAGVGLLKTKQNSEPLARSQPPAHVQEWPIESGRYLGLLLQTIREKSVLIAFSSFIESYFLKSRQRKNPRATDREQSRAAMVTLVVATTTDPASIGPASALLAMPNWHPGPFLQDIPSFVNGTVRLLKHDSSIVKEDNLDKRWEQLTGEVVNEVIFLSKHTAVSNQPALTVHPIGVPHLRENEIPPAGGKPGWAALPNPRIGPWLRLLKTVAKNHNLIPEFEVTLEATHHGPEVNAPTMFVEIGSTEEYWKRQDAAQAIALLLWLGLGLDGSDGVGNWNGNGDKNKVLLGIGGGHYVPRHMDIALKDGVWVGHLLSGYSLPMEDPSHPKEQNSASSIGGTWKQAIKVAFEATKSAFPGGEVIAHLDQKSFKGWQKTAITGFLAEENIRIGKPKDFI